MFNEDHEMAKDNADNVTQELLTITERDIVDQALAAYVQSLERRARKETNPKIKRYINEDISQANYIRSKINETTRA